MLPATCLMLAYPTSLQIRGISIHQLLFCVELLRIDLVNTPSEFVCHCFFFENEDDEMMRAFKAVPGVGKSGNPAKVI